MQKYSPLPGLWDNRELSRNDVQLLSAAILGFVKAAEQVTAECAAQTPLPTSAAWRMFKSEERDHFIDAFITMQYSNLSAFDHARAFVTLIRTPSVRSTALATTARGAMESFARTFFLLSRRNDLDLIHRSISLLRSDLYYPARFGEEITTRNGEPLDVNEQRAFMSAELSRLSLPEPRKIALATMVEDMLSGEFEEDVPTQRYSAISAIAHAHRLAINTFVATDDGGEIAGLIAPRAAVLEVAVYLLASFSATMPPFVELYGPNVQQKERIHTAAYRVASAVKALSEDRP